MKPIDKVIVGLVLCALVIVGLLCAVLPLYGDSYQNVQLKEPSVALEDGWVLVQEDGSVEPVTMPYLLPDGEKPYVFHYFFDTPPEIDAGAAIMLRMVDTGYRLFAHGEQIAQYPEQPFAISKTTSNTIQFAHLPLDYAGEPLTLVIEPLLGNQVRYEVSAPVLGEEASLVAGILVGELPLLVMLLLVVVCSAVLLILHWAMLREQSGGTFLWMFLFCLTFSAYGLLTTRTFQLILPNTYLPYMAANLLMTLLPIIAMMAFYSDVQERYKRPVRIMVYLCLLNFAGQAILSFTSIFDLREMMPITHGLMILMLCVMIYIFVRSMRPKNPPLRRMVVSCAPMMAGIVIDILRFALLPQSEYPALTFLIGMLFFIGMQMGYFVKEYLSLYRETVRNEMFRNMAYNDLLTGLKNRNAYEERIAEIQEQLHTEIQLWCIVADINNLKQINDAHGHSEGDKLIINTAKLLHAVIDDAGELFRTGGDEFVAFILGRDQAFMDDCIERFRASVADYNETETPHIRVAVGTGLYHADTDTDLLSFIHRVDTMMYQDKRNPDRRQTPRA